jgi:hypothetical protein
MYKVMKMACYYNAYWNYMGRPHNHCYLHSQVTQGILTVAPMNIRFLSMNPSLFYDVFVCDALIYDVIICDTLYMVSSMSLYGASLNNALSISPVH